MEVNQLKCIAIYKTIAILEEIKIKYRKRDFTDDNVVVFQQPDNDFLCLRCMIVFDDSERSKSLQKEINKLLNHVNVKVLQYAAYFEYAVNELELELENDNNQFLKNLLTEKSMKEQGKEGSENILEIEEVINHRDTLIIAKDILKKKTINLNEVIKISEKIDNPSSAEILHLERCKIVVIALTEFVKALDKTDSYKQKEALLPILKNNDQRKEWVENYWAWGEWYYDIHIDCHYYKYDFPNGDRLIVEEYRDRYLYWRDEKQNEQNFHLLRKEKHAYKDRTYEEQYSHQTTSTTEIVDYLRDLQKK